MQPQPLRFTESPNAWSKSISTAEGIDTHGVLNRHSTQNNAYAVGVCEDKGTRRYMEDAHSFVVDYAGVRGQGFFAIFDGHAGKHAAEWCGGHFHEVFLDALRATPERNIPDTLNEAFHNVDLRLSKMSEESEGKIHSGCTAVAAFLRIEDSDGKQSFLTAIPDLDAINPPSPDEDSESATNSGSEKAKAKKANNGGSKIKRALKSLSGSGLLTPRSMSPTGGDTGTRYATGVTVIVPPPGSRRVLYSANAGDARGVLCRGGKAVRLTYDHKGSDKQEAKRITDAGGFVMGGRVNGVLAVTRSLGDSSMKEFVVGSPYTTETELCEDDDLLILACDGLWDVAGDQQAVDLVSDVQDAQEAAEKLLTYALNKSTTDNVTVLVVRFKKAAERNALASPVS
ncbi:protein serine/threonine phosphatase 2C [Athelia psychrophila]|uniref:Protein serine/threonine phosphatase 2C n=1 Tax=Athelia psychrophila TaxID=1759441 RepID=A0A166X6R1_9AGAM|nr:protein serine/threonine phosphatase 2C [Fibularhizoctonia sp. CBS 109695]